MARDTYFISFDGVNYTQIYPANNPKVKLIQESNEIFKRWKVDEFRLMKINNSTVITTIGARFFDPDYFTSKVYWQIKENGTLTYSFVSSLVAGTYNSETGKYIAKPEADDAYRDIMLQYERKFHRGTGSAFNGDGEVAYPTADTGNFASVNFSTFTDVGGTINYSNTTSGKATANNPLAMGVSSGRDCLVYISNLVVTAGDEPRIKLTDIGGADKSNVENLLGDGWYILTASGTADRVEIAQTDDGNNSAGSFDYEIYHYQNYKSVAGRPLKSALDDVLNNASFMNLSLGTPVSSILWNDALPTGHAADTPNISTYFTANPTNDYVLEAAAIWNNLLIGRTDAWTTSKESDLQYSLKDIMDILKLKLRLWWFIDPDGKFRIEHEKYLRDFASQADLTAAGYADQKIEVDCKEYSFELGDTYSQINYIENNAANEDWIASPVLFDPLPTSKNAKDVRVDVTTDIKYLVDNPDDAQSSGFTLMRCETMGGGYRISLDESTKTAGVFYANAKLGWYFLCANYMEYFAEALTGTVNGSAHTFDHARETLKQKTLRFHPAASIDWKKPLTLSRGTGWIREVEYRPDSAWCDCAVEYNPYA